MSRFHAARCSLPLSLVGFLALMPAALFGGDRPKGVNTQIDPAHETVALLEGIERGQFEATLIVKDSTVCRLMVKNLSDRPLNVELPAAMAGVPVLAQFQQQGFGQQGFGQQGFGQQGFGQGGMQAPQQVGIGGQQNNWMNNNNNNNNNNLFNLGPGGGQQNQRFPGIFNIAPEKVGKFKLACVCLEHGKPNPKAKIAYRVVPLESVAAKAEVAEICAMLGRGEIVQKVAQAAAWHFNNGMSWERLKAQKRTMAMGRISEPFFTGRELAAAKAAAELAEKRAKQRKHSTATTSLSRN